VIRHGVAARQERPGQRVIGVCRTCLAVLALTSCGGGAERDEASGEVTASGDVDAFELRVGDCLGNLPGETAAEEVSNVDAVPTGSARGMGQAAALPAPASPPPGEAAPAVGSCLDAAGNLVDCAAPHDAEIYALVDLPESAWPGQEAIDTTAEQACFDPFAAYVGVPYDQSALGIAFLTPDEASWGAGDRQVGCVVVDPAGPLTGTVQGSGR